MVRPHDQNALKKAGEARPVDFIHAKATHIPDLRLWPTPDIALRSHWIEFRWARCTDVFLLPYRIYSIVSRGL